MPTLLVQDTKIQYSCVTCAQTPPLALVAYVASGARVRGEGGGRRPEQFSPEDSSACSSIVQLGGVVVGTTAGYLIGKASGVVAGAIGGGYLGYEAGKVIDRLTAGPDGAGPYVFSVAGAGLGAIGGAIVGQEAGGVYGAGVGGTVGGILGGRAAASICGN